MLWYTKVLSRVEWNFFKYLTKISYLKSFETKNDMQNKKYIKRLWKK